MNPLLQDGGPPPFSLIRAEHVTPAMDRLLAAAETALERAVSAEVATDYDALSLVLDVPVERLHTAWGHVCHLQATVDTPQLRAAHALNLPRVIDFDTRLGADQRLFAKFKALAVQGQAALTPARRKALTDTLRDFVLGGAELAGAARARYAAIQERAGELSQTFDEHVLDATDAYALYVGEDELQGVPQDVRQAARAAAQAGGRTGCKLTLKPPCYVPLIKHADHRPLREALYRAYATRASELGRPEFDNTSVMRELLQLRQEEAGLLGYANYGDLSLASKMASSTSRVLDFVRDLARRARPFAEHDLAELRRYATRELGLDDLQAWDQPYAAEKLMQSRYAFSSEEVRQYFTLPRVLQGLFQLIETLFGVAVRADEAPVWNDSVRHYSLWRGEQQVAGLYLDLYARSGKQSGAWMDSCRARWRRPDRTLQLPVAHLVCNFTPPVGIRPALLTHDDLITLFHEFGHGLHHMLTQVDDLAVSGIAGVEHDAVELPSQFMENFCWEWEVLQGLSAHVDSGEALPRALFDRMIAARNFHSALALSRQCEFALFDMRLHTERDAAARVQTIAEEVNAEIQTQAVPPFNRHAASFSHLFGGGYAAGYYGYAWAQVLSADAFGAFEDKGVFDSATGNSFRENILEVGGSRPAMESFLAFRGREPTLEALLRHQGLA